MLIVIATFQELLLIISIKSARFVEILSWKKLKIMRVLYSMTVSTAFSVNLPRVRNDVGT